MINFSYTNHPLTVSLPCRLLFSFIVINYFESSSIGVPKQDKYERIPLKHGHGETSKNSERHIRMTTITWTKERKSNCNKDFKFWKYIN